MLEKLRRNIFWMLDTYKGSKVKAHMEEISYILENINSEEVTVKRKSALDELLQHAVNNTKFYSPYKYYNELSDFPIITKMDIRENYKDFIVNDPKFKPEFEISTSGTTGVPFSVCQDLNKKNRNTADTLYFAEKGGFEIGDRLYYIRFWSKQTSRSAFAQFVTNIKQIHVFDLSASFLKSLIARMNKDASRKALLGYSSALSELVRYMKANEKPPLKNPFKSIITMAEGISNKQREELQSYLGAPVISRYSNSENGIFAQQIIGGGKDYHINWASYEVEVLDLNENVPAKPGEVGRIVITDLFNYCMPIIRYDTGDLGILSKENTHFNRAPTLRSIEGRRMDVIYNTKGEALSPYVAYEMEYFPELKQFQLIQEEKNKYTVKVNLDGVFESEEAATKRLMAQLGKDAIINFEYVDEFPQLASGKRRLAVNNYKN
ncbi:CoF synthetase [Robiginitalea aurantiaca]|uniref:CoF synthetase n=1 Tax=Robiginitalea aurantiaca TaxID=3056915 RepID=A0ABT7WIP0_9FLAO|nr:CoF synthetase [Robiginitalea aurantiaca]MDM9632788.1 CoF synthetase [Robiginitalea aurantiaca]